MSSADRSSSTLPGLPGQARMPGRRLLGLVGLAAVALTLPAFVLVPPAPAVGTPAGEIASYYAEHRDAFLRYGWLLGLSVPLMLCHVAAVSQWMREQPRLPRWLWLTYGGGAIAAHTVQLVLLAVFQILAFLATPAEAGAVAGTGPDLVPAAELGTRPLLAALSDLANVGFAFYAIVEILPLAAATVAIVRTAVVWRWLAWLTGAAVLLCLLGSIGTMARSGPLAGGALLVVLWYLAFLAAFGLANIALVVGRAGRTAS